MKVKKFYSIVLLPNILATTLTEPPTKTITEVLTITYTPSEAPKDYTVTKTFYETVNESVRSFLEQEPLNTPNPAILEHATAENGKFGLKYISKMILLTNYHFKFKFLG